MYFFAVREALVCEDSELWDAFSKEERNEMMFREGKKKERKEAANPLPVFSIFLCSTKSSSGKKLFFMVFWENSFSVF